MEKDSRQSHKQTNELIFWLIEHHLSIKSLSMFAEHEERKRMREGK